MEIKVAFDHGKLTFSPDPAIVQRGTLVNWNFRAKSLLPSQVRWVVYFNEGSPFRGQDSELITNTSNAEEQSIGTSRPMSADDPGDYKYGVRVVDADKHQTLADDDPWLIVK